MPSQTFRSVEATRRIGRRLTDACGLKPGHLRVGEGEQTEFAKRIATVLRHRVP